MAGLPVNVNDDTFFNIDPQLQALQSFVIPRRRIIAREDKLRLIRAYRNREYNLRITCILSINLRPQDQLFQRLEGGNLKEFED